MEIKEAARIPHLHQFQSPGAETEACGSLSFALPHSSNQLSSLFHPPLKRLSCLLFPLGPSATLQPLTVSCPDLPKGFPPPMSSPFHPSGTTVPYISSLRCKTDYVTFLGGFNIFSALPAPTPYSQAQVQTLAWPQRPFACGPQTLFTYFHTSVLLHIFSLCLAPSSTSKLIHPLKMHPKGKEMQHSA